MYSAYKLNKQGDNIQPCGTPFPIWNQSVVPCSVLTVASWPAYRFLKSQVRWSGIPISFRIFQFVVIHTVKGFGIVNKAGVEVFLELSCFFNDPMDVGNLISGSSAFLKPAWISGSSQFTYCLLCCSPSPHNWENKTSTATQMQKGNLLPARARAQVTSSAVEWSKGPEPWITAVFIGLRQRQGVGRGGLVAKVPYHLLIG